MGTHERTKIEAVLHLYAKALKETQDAEENNVFTKSKRDMVQSPTPFTQDHSQATIVRTTRQDLSVSDTD